MKLSKTIFILLGKSVQLLISRKLCNAIREGAATVKLASRLGQWGCSIPSDAAFLFSAFKLTFYSWLFSSTEGRDTQKRLKALNAAVLRLSRNIKELQDENRSLKEDLDHVVSTSLASNKTKSRCWKVGVWGTTDLGTFEKCVWEGGQDTTMVEIREIRQRWRFVTGRSWNEKFLTIVSPLLVGMLLQ